ncbi:MAG: hypothetical protein AMXMBFR82_09730 [Candidatus Hydrogenedentota bacterium]
MAGCAVSAAAEDIAIVRDQFAAPPADYSTGPLWVWNDWMTESEIRQTLQDLASQHVMQAFVHPRPGLMTPYLSDRWFEMWAVTLDEAGKLGMNIWIYDENSYPSGFAGGFVPELLPESKGQGLVFEEVAAVPQPLPEDVLAVYTVADGNFTKADASSPLPAGNYILAKRAWAQPSPWFGGKTYVDLLRPGVTEKFLEVTMDAYKDAFGDEFGKRVPGAFTDEPHLVPGGDYHWTPDLPEVFQKRWGYDLMEHLASLQCDLGDWKKVRHDYYSTLNELFVERWAKPYYAYCEQNGLEFTGHYWEHEWPRLTRVPDNMTMAAWQQAPGIDILFNQYAEGVHAQVGNVRAVVELASVANQLGRSRRLCEAYGGGGWDLRFDDMKRIGDWMSALGVSFINQHLTHSTLRGARKGDYPQSFSYHAPWWGSYHVLADYFARLGLAVSHGQQINDVLVLEPTTTAWMYQGPGREHNEQLGEAFQSFVTQLAKDNVEFDIGCEYIMSQWGRVENGKLVVGQRDYSIFVVPRGTESLDDATVRLLDEFVKAGGTVLDFGDVPPAMVDGRASDRVLALATHEGWKKTEGSVLQTRQQSEGPFSITLTGDGRGIVYHMRRSFADGDLVFIVNTSDAAQATAVLRSNMNGVERWDLESGETGIAYPFEALESGGVRASIELPACGSLLLYLPKDAGVATPAPADAPQWAAIPAAGAMAVNRTSPNVLTLDYVDVRVGDEAREAQYYYAAAEFVFQKHGLERNPWDHAVQFNDELITTTFPEGGGFEATYRFTIDGDVPSPLYAVVERTDLYTITCNEKSVTPLPGEWWLDRAFGVVDITDCAVTGDNTLTVRADAFSMYHELERAYLLGDFSLLSTDSGFHIVGPRDLEAGPWDRQGCPLYCAGVAYTQTFTVDATSGSYQVKLPAWLGSVAKVRVNGEDAGIIYRRPSTRDVSSLIRPGENIVEVEVIGTPKNTLGPHHGAPPLGIASPGMFRNGPIPGPPPGAEYSTIGYGLFAPFELQQAG